MNTEQIDQPGGNKRAAFRCALDGTYQEASLKTERVEYPAQLLDESAGGFAIRVQGPLDVKANDLVRLHTNSGWFQVRVANVAEENVAEENVAEETDAETERNEEGDRDPKGGDRLPPAFRLGLQRLRDVEPWDDPTTHTSWFSRLPRASLQSWENPLALVGTGTIALVGLVVLAVGLFMWQAGYPVTDLFKMNESKSSSRGSVLPRLGKHISESFRFAVKKMPAGLVPDSLTESATPSSSTSPASPANPASSTAYKSDLRGAINRLSGVAVFALPDVVRELSLTAAQQAEIRQISEAASEALHHIDRYWKTGNRQEQAKARAQIHEEARQHVIGKLTPEQRKKWDELQGER